MKVEIYEIFNEENGWRYIGSTNDSHKRVTKHFWELQNNKHHCILLQKDYNKYTKDVFKFSVIDEVDEEYRDINEELYISIYDDKLYNTMLVPHHHSKETMIEIGNKLRTWKIPEMKKLLRDLIDNQTVSIYDTAKKHNITRETFNETIIRRRSNQSILDDEIEELIKQYKNSPRSTVSTKTITGIFFKSPDNEIFEVTESLNKFAKGHGLDASALTKVKNKKFKQHKGWTLYEQN